MEEDAGTYLAIIDAYREQLEAIEAQSAYIQALINDYLKAKLKRNYQNLVTTRLYFNLSNRELCLNAKVLNS